MNVWKVTLYLIPQIDVDDVDPSEDPEDLSVDVEDEEEASNSGETSLSPDARTRGRVSSPLSCGREEDNEMEDDDDDEIADEDDIEDDTDAVKRDHPKVRESKSSVSFSLSTRPGESSF